MNRGKVPTVVGLNNSIKIIQLVDEIYLVQGAPG
jgi:hypothetical protein